MKLFYEPICAQAISANLSTKVHTLTIHPNTSFEFSSLSDTIRIFSRHQKAHGYSRYGNPTVEAVAERIA